MSRAKDAPQQPKGTPASSKPKKYPPPPPVPQIPVPPLHAAAYRFSSQEIMFPTSLGPPLPISTQEIVLLDLEPTALKSYNVLQASIAITLISNKDYLFHPMNSENLQAAVRKLSQIMFWSVDEKMYNVDEILRTFQHVQVVGDGAAASIKVEDELADVKPATSKDSKLLIDAFQYLGIAATDHSWRTFQRYDGVPYLAYDTARSSMAPFAANLVPVGYMQPNELRELRNPSSRQPLSAQENFARSGRSARTQPVTTVKVVEETPRSETSYIGSSGSSKLNFIINEVLQHSQQERFLIFSESLVSLSHIADALELIRVEYRHFSPLSTARVMEEFNLFLRISQHCRVFLVPLKYCLPNIIATSASRIIFCEPVWDVRVEDRAIAACHRYGQTWPVTVKTLAIAGTFEERMMARRMEVKPRENDPMPKLVQDVDMRAYFANPAFVPQTSIRLPVLDPFPLVPVAETFIPSASTATTTKTKRTQSAAAAENLPSTSASNSTSKRRKVDTPLPLPPSRSNSDA